MSRLRSAATTAALATSLTLLAACGGSTPAAAPPAATGNPASPTSAPPVPQVSTPAAPPSRVSPPSSSPPSSSPPSSSRPPASPPSSNTPPTSTPPTTRPSPSPTSGGITPAPLPARLAGVDWTRLPTSRHVVALTFDAGANADGVPSILRTLAATGVPATFFLTGTWVRTYPEQARRIAARYPVGNHTVSHPHLPALTDSAVRAQVDGAEAAVTQVTGRSPRPLFRFPFGDVNSRVLRDVNAAGYLAVRWTVDTLGWKGTSSGMTAARVQRRVLDGLTPGEIVLMHVGSHPQDRSTLDADALPGLIAEIQAHGYGFVTVSSLLG